MLVVLAVLVVVLVVSADMVVVWWWYWLCWYGGAGDAICGAGDDTCGAGAGSISGVVGSAVHACSGSLRRDFSWPWEILTASKVHVVSVGADVSACFAVATVTPAPIFHQRRLFCSARGIINRCLGRGHTHTHTNTHTHTHTLRRSCSV